MGILYEKENLSLPGGRNATMVRASKRVWRARSGTAVEIVLVRVVAAIVVPIAKPIRFDTDGCTFALQVAFWALNNLIFTRIQSFVRRTVIFTIIDSVTFLTVWNTAIIFASEFAIGTIFVLTI